MKLVRKIILIFAFLPLISYANPIPVQVQEDIVLAIKTGNARELAKYIGETIEISIEGASEVYSKAQAEQVLKDFFAKNVPDAFEIKHNSTVNESVKFGIGELKTKSGKNFRVVLYTKQQGDQYYIQELNFEES